MRMEMKKEEWRRHFRRRLHAMPSPAWPCLALPSPASPSLPASCMSSAPQSRVARGICILQFAARRNAMGFTKLESQCR